MKQCFNGRKLYIFELLAVDLHEGEGLGGRLAIYDGESVLFDGSSSTVIMIAKLLWHYGWDVFKIQSYVKDLLQDFARYSKGLINSILLSKTVSHREMEHHIQRSNEIFIPKKTFGK